MTTKPSPYQHKENDYNTFSDKQPILGESDPPDVHIENADKPPKRKSSKVLKKFADFANVFKAFIGSGYTAMPYGFTQSGLLLGVLCILVVSFITNHCCNIILTCKHRVTNLLMEKDKMTVENMSEEEYERKVDEIEKNLSYGDIGHVAIGHMGTKLVNIFVLITQFGFCVLYFIILGNIIAAYFPLKGVIIWEGGNVTEYREFPLPEEQLELAAVRDVLMSNTTIHSSTITPNHTLLTTPSVNINTTVIPTIPEPTSDSSLINHWVKISSAPFFGLLMLIPLPVLVITSFMRNIRHMGPVSVVANITLLSAFFIIVSFLASDIHYDHVIQIYHSIGLFRWSTFPIFFSQITGAFEGIGTVIPIESSMRENRRRFPLFLMITLMLICLILGSIGILGCLVYGEHVNQIVLNNLPQSSVVLMMANALMFVGVLFTYPLQIYPIIEIIEEMLFLPGKLLGPSFEEMAEAEVTSSTRSDEGKKLLSYVEDLVINDHHDSDDDEDDDNMVLPLAASIPDQVKAWKRNLLRILIVVVTASLAIVLKDSFAHVTAFTGAVGSAMLAYVLPCLFHLKLHKGTLSKFVIIKNISLMVFGLVGAIVGVTVVLMEMAKS